MANSLLIEKETGGYFGFTLTIDSVVHPKVRNMRNDAFAIDNIVHFKTATGANIVKQQNISIFDITLIASGTFTFTDIDTFIEKLVDVGYWEWMLGAGSGGADRFDEMLDTFDYFGNDMKGVRVNESQMKLEPFTVYNYRKSTDLEDMPSVLIPNKMFVVNEDATGVVLKDQPETPITYLNAVGTFHYADLATQTVPLVILPATPKKLTNDAEGVYTNLANTPYGVSSVWNTATNQLDFTQLSLGDTLTFRLDAIITTSAINQTAKAYIKFGVGSLSEFDLIISQAGIKTAGSYPFVSEVSFDLAYQDIVDNPAEIYIESDDDATLKINGWYIEILRKNINIVDLPTSIRQDVDFGVISSDAVDAINNAIPNILIQDQNLGQIKIQGTFNGVYHEYLFTGIKGYYGNGALQCTLNDLIEIGGSGGGGGATNLGYTASPTNGIVTSDTGTDATIPLADNTNAGLLSSAEKTVIANTSGTNTGDQDLQITLENGSTATDSSITLENTENSNNTYINSNYIQLENPSINEKIQLISDDNSGVFINITDNNNSSVFNIKKDRLFWNNGSGENELILSRTSIDSASYSFPEKPTGNYTLATTSDGIPITGTTVGNPMVGTFETTGVTFVGNTGVIQHSLELDENVAMIGFDGTYTSTFGLNLNANVNSFNIGSNSPSFRGLSTGGQDFSPNITDLDYPQKIYVDSAITTSTTGKEDVANKSNSYTTSSTITYPNTKALVDGLAANAQKSNLPEIALNRYRSIPNSSPRKIAWIGDSVTMHTGFYMIDSRDSSTRTLDTYETFLITDISAAGICTSSTTHNLLVNSVIQSTTTSNGFVSNSFYYISEVISPTQFKIVSNAFAAVTLTAGTGLSITISFASFYDNRVARYAGGPMYKVTNGAFGLNGSTAANFLNSVGNSAINLGFEQVVDFEPNLIVYSYGINDVRLGITTQAQLEASISSTVENFKIRLPNTDIILRMPNHLCYDTGTLITYLGAGTTYAQAQERSDRLRLAYRAMIAKYANVYVLDTQGGDGAIFSEKIPNAINTYMSDCLHPNITDGQGAIFREVLLSIGNFGKTRAPLNSEPSKFYPQISTVVSANATYQSANDYLIFPRVVEDPTKYNLLFKGKRAASAKGSYWDVGKYKIGVAEAKNYTNVIKPNDIAVVYGTLEYTAGSQGEYFDNGVAAFKLTTANVATQGNNFRITSLPAGYPMTNGTLQEVAFYRAKPTTQLRPANNDFNEVVSFVDFTAQTTHKIIEQFSVCAVITGISNTAPTTGGTITLNKNGVAFATLTWANAATTATGSGTFFTDATRGIVFDEGDILSVIVNSDFAGGTIPKIRLSNK